jgi:hypothetical protein
MNNCKGFLGWMFGHKFESCITEIVTHNMEPFISASANPKQPFWFLEELAEELKDKKYLVICKRCGEKKEN